MAFAVANIDKFINDHPEIKELTDRRLEIIKNAHEKADERGVIASGAIKDLLGDHAKAFFEEAMNDLDHIELGLQAFRVAAQNSFLLKK